MSSVQVGEFSQTKLLHVNSAQNKKQTFPFPQKPLPYGLTPVREATPLSPLELTSSNKSQLTIVLH